MNIQIPPAIKQFAAPMIQHGFTRWRSLTTRGQRFALLATTIVVLGLLWAWVYAPLQSSRDRNTQRIITMQAQHAVIQTQSAELAKLRSVAPVAATRNQTLADQNSLESIFGAAAKVNMTANGEFRIVVPVVRYVEWLDRVDQALARFRLRIMRIDIKRLDASAAGSTGGSLVSAEIVFSDFSPGTGSTAGSGSKSGSAN